MARKKEDRNTRRTNRDSEWMAQGRQPNGQQYYQQAPNDQYYQQGANGQYYQQAPNDQYYQGEDGQYYQQMPNGQQYYQQQYYQQPYMGYQESAVTKKPKKKRKRRWILFILEIIILIILAATLYVVAKLSKYESVNIDENKIVQNVQEQLPEQVAAKLKGYWNIALYGIDSREGVADYAQSDTIIVASINKDTKEVRLASVYRDTYLSTLDGGFTKATDYYSARGAEGSIGMLNRNLDLDISDYVTVNMNILADVIDALGGIEIDVREDEVVHLNNYQNEGSEITGMEKIPVSAGLQTLNGLQAMSYCRIRYTEPQYIDGVYHEGLDYERAQRQRKVLDKIFEKVQTMDIMTLNSLIDMVLPNISTNLTTTEILSLAKDVAAYKLGETTGFPNEKQTADTDAGDCVVPINLAQNVTELHKFLFDGEEYTPSDTVQSISNDIAYLTGIY